jgi:hypothetical protein
MTSKTAVKIIDCECNGTTCCGGRGIAVYEVVRSGKKIKLCTKCDLPSDRKTRRILPYVKDIPAKKLINFDPLGAMCLAFDLADKKRTV